MMLDVELPAFAATPVVSLSEVRFSWPGANAFTLAIDRFDVGKGERLFLAGPSGGGKSTLLSLLAGVVKPQKGHITILGRDLVTMRGATRDRFRSEHYGIIFQQFNLLPYGSVIDNVLLPLRFSPVRRARAGQNRTIEKEAARLLGQLGLEGSIINSQSASRLSVGQQQRVAAARALIGSPEIIIADEPTSSLDRNRQQGFLDLMFASIAEAQSTLIMVSHDESLSSRFDRVVRLDEIASVSQREAA